MKIFITKAVCNDDLTVQLRFNDNTEKTVDIGNFIRKNPHPQYEKYLQPKNFKKAKLESGNIVWGKNWDLIFPIEDLYIGCIR